VFTRIIEETYQRAVGPNVASLKGYEAFSSETYGELMPTLLSEIFRNTGLTADSLFLDLGSGVGNVVLQASLETGCRSFGIEVRDATAKLAASQLEQMKIRCRMWGVTMGEVELVQGDMLKSARVDELVSQADVILVNNKVFSGELNEAIKPKFLDLKEGAIIVSLKPFFTELTERNLDDICAIFRVTAHKYYSGSVSWSCKSDKYYIHRVDRKYYAQKRHGLETSLAQRSAPTRSTRSRR